ncbi:hypothetical protein [Micrococcoides hystricis]|uniref:Integral membrane protein n=1 Tax=Micrococcoides hystricis TaxID=1572761 RepID=A0ABV6PAS3_9MICC
MTFDGYMIAASLVCAAAAIAGIIATIRVRHAADSSIIGLALVELFLIVFGIGHGLMLAQGHTMAGPGLEFWGYFLTAIIIPPIAFFWAVTDKTRWSNLIMAAVAITIWIMIWRMNVLWYVGANTMFNL